MKIIQRLLIMFLLLLLPLSLMAMAPVSDLDLSEITGQAGVNINADLAMDVAIGTMAWGDSDGLTAAGGPWGTTASGGYVGVSGFNMTNLRIKARETDTYGTPAWNTTMLKPITIDVASDPYYILYNGATFVRFGLGSLQITMDSMSFDVVLGTSPAAMTEVMGSANIGSMELYINPYSYVDIYNSRPGARQGIYITMNIIIDQFQLGYMSWGDADGLPAGNTGQAVIWMANGAQTAGYVGLDNLVIGGPITIAGTMMIDVTTSSAGVYSHGSPGTPTSVVHILFPALFQLNVTGPITADVKLDSAAALNSANAGTLGDIYVAGFGLDIHAGSWVDIWAH